MTPGREEDSAADEDVRLFSKQDFKDKTNASTAQSSLFAQQIIDALGGPQNISQFDNCISRLRVEVIDPARVASDDVWKKSLRAKGVVHVSEKGLQVIYGAEVVMIAGDCKELLGEA